MEDGTPSIQLQQGRVPVQALLDAQRAPAVLEALKQNPYGRALFSPVIDGDVIRADTDACRAVAAGRADVLAGHLA
ncbi:hypothetical protein GSY71_14295 [Pusillimonas sp. TS35]|uniref:hypothetical protein n=1 Tax=Paracandidimonas lactea TaxID=2895524 RepID=UPI0013705AC5|nr:hypothetical protein [Paracandidimonas lactea]MYN14310.1 hypothetical protein [Pusillimonas sp. TS35]